MGKIALVLIVVTGAFLVLQPPVVVKENHAHVNGTYHNHTKPDFKDSEIPASSLVVGVGVSALAGNRTISTSTLILKKYPFCADRNG